MEFGNPPQASHVANVSTSHMNRVGQFMICSPIHMPEFTTLPAAQAAAGIRSYVARYLGRSCSLDADNLRPRHLHRKGPQVIGQGFAPGCFLNSGTRIFGSWLAAASAILDAFDGWEARQLRLGY